MVLPVTGGNNRDSLTGYLVSEMSALLSFPAAECRSIGYVLVKMGTLPRRGAERDRQGVGVK